MHALISLIYHTHAITSSSDTLCDLPLSLSLSLSQDIFVSLSQVDGVYFVCNIDDFKFLADMIQHIPLNLRSRYVFCTAPINKKQPFVCTSFLKVSMSEAGRRMR